ncbi:MAG: cation transporter [Oligoflexales bacterium]|nr:cation transporter [Oligoflexales bacterium]
MSNKNQKLKNMLKDNASLALIFAAIVSFFLVIFKGVAFTLTGSMLVLTSLLDSIADSINSLINYYIYKISREKADKEHPFGHGGFEVVGSLIQGMILIFFGLNLLLESYRSIGNPQIDEASVHSLPIAGVMLLGSAAVGVLIILFQDYTLIKRSFKW